MTAPSDKLARGRALAVDADVRARHAIAELADEMLADAPSCRRLIAYLITTPMSGACAAAFAQSVGLRQNTLVTRFARAYAPSIKRIAPLITAVRLGSMLEHPNVSASICAGVLGASSPQSLMRHFMLTQRATIPRWRLKTSGANELSKLRAFLKLHVHHYAAVTLASPAVPIAPSLPAPICSRCGGDVKVAA
jgi:hypothetical protein